MLAIANTILSLKKSESTKERGRFSTREQVEAMGKFLSRSDINRIVTGLGKPIGGIEVEPVTNERTSLSWMSTL